MRGAGLPGRPAPLGGPAVRHPPPARPHPLPLARLPAQRLRVPPALPGPGHRGLHPAGNTGQAVDMLSPLGRTGVRWTGGGAGRADPSCGSVWPADVWSVLHCTNRCTIGPAMQYWRAVEVLLRSCWPCYSGVMADRSILYNCFHRRPVQPRHSPPHNCNLQSCSLQTGPPQLYQSSPASKT